jgi:hypothetical protein
VDANYSISYVTGTITIGQAPLTITASGASTNYGSVPVTTASFSGFVNGDSSASLTTQPTCSTAASGSSAAGTYPTSCSGAADPNYSISYVAGVITVGQAPLAITASGGSMTYGGSVPSITASFGGFVNGDTAASLTTRPTCSTIATSSTGDGNYASSCTGAADANYAISYSGGSVTVSPAPLTVVVNNFSRAFGVADAFTGTITGAVNGDVITAGYSAGDTATSNVGTYTIIATLASSPSGALSNYTVSNTPGTLTVNKANQTISFTAPNADPYGTVIPLSASASSALPASLSLVSGPATLVNGTLTLTGTGTVVVEADQTGNGNWNAAPAIRATINATQAVLTVTANNQSCVYGTCDGDFDSDDASHQVSYSITGLVGSDTISGRARLTTNTPEGGPVGTYAITVNQGTLTASSNYSFRLVNGTLTITPAVLTVKAKNVTFTYGGHGVGHGDEGDRCESDHGRDDGECGFGHLGYTVTGLVNGDSPRVFGGQPALSTTATQNSPAGLYPILLGIGSFHASTNYVVQLVNGMVIVNKAVLTVEANNLSRPVNTANPPLTYSFDGFENGDNAAVLGGAPALTTTALITSPAGAYPIAIAFGTLTSANYTFAFQNGQLRVGHGDGDHGEGDHRDDSHHDGHDH